MIHLWINTDIVPIDQQNTHELENHSGSHQGQPLQLD